MALFGYSQKIVPSILCILFRSFENFDIMSLCTNLFLRLVSPSKFLVSIYSEPLATLLFTIAISAGMASSSHTLTRLPGFKSFQTTSSHYPVFCLYTLVALKFSSLSDLFLLWSSKASFSIATNTTAASGYALAGTPFDIEIDLIVYMYEMIKK